MTSKRSLLLAGLLVSGLLASLHPVVAQKPEADGKARLEAAETRLASARTAENELAVAEARRDLFELDKALAHFEAAVNLDKTPAASRAQIDYLLALGNFDSAGAALDRSLAQFGEDGILLEQRAALAAARGKHAEAVSYLERSWNAGRPPLAWLERGRIEEHLHAEPYRSLLDADILMGGLAELSMPALEKRLNLLAEALDAANAPKLTRFLAGQQDSGVLRLGLRALRSLENPAEHLDALLRAEIAQVRRAALLDIWSQRDVAAHRAAIEGLRADNDLGNADLAEVLLAVDSARGQNLAAAEKTLRGVSAYNAYRHLALQVLEERFSGDGLLARASEVAGELAVLEPTIAAARGDKEILASYWECMERQDMKENRERLYHHRYVERIDARIYGLPKNDFDDQKNLTIPERLFLRSHFRQLGEPLATEGTQQYPREIRHFLRKLEREQGKAADCSGRLAALPMEPSTRALTENSETKVEEDTAADNESNVAVNPNDPRYVIVTNNPDGGGTGNAIARSSDWGKTWTNGAIATANNCCDPVTQYTRTSVGGTMTDVAYHSTLAGTSLGSRLLYSTNNGSTWSECGTTIGAGRDRQDHVIDSNPSSSCYNKIYVAQQNTAANGDAMIATSTGTTFPYCQSFTELNSGVTGTIGPAVVVSSNGVAHHFITQHASPGGIYHQTTSNCGSSWSTPVKQANITNAGDFEWPIPSTCSRQVYRYSQAGTDTQPSSAYLNNVYVVWNDLSGNCTAPGCNGNTTCNNDIYLLVGVPNNRSNPTSWTFTSRNLTDALSDDYTDEFYPSLSVDPADGAVYVSYYRTNSGSASITPRKTQVHYVLTKSIDGGATFVAPYQITNQPTDESGSGANSAMQWGDYTWNDVVKGVTYATWTDRREGADEDIWASKICSEPTHWSERAPTFTAPATTATNTSGLNYTVSWALPNVYWGDGDENPAARKFQLWVNGVLTQDNIAATATSTTYTAPDTTSRTLQIRAVNQCGASKSYASATIGSGGGGNTAPTVTITAPANGSSFVSGTSVTFTGTATDTQDGTISGSLAWTSSLGGSIGSGASFSTSSLAVGTHTITAAVTDAGGLSGSASISVTITSAPPTNVLTNGVPVTGIAGALQSNTFYTLAVPAGATNLSFVTSGGTGDADLYVRFGSAPTTTTNDCASTSATTAETCSFATPSTGTYHVLIYGYSAYSGVTLTGSYTAPGGSVTVTLYSVAAQDGRLFESTETSNVGGTGNSTDNTTAALRVGDFSDDTQYKTLVSFDTSSIPDTATITAATLRLKRGTLSGTSPFTTHGTCTVDMSNAFGGSTAFAGADFQAAATTTGVATMSSPASNGTFSTGTLSAAGRTAINKTGTTQFRVNFTLDDNDDLGSDYIGFYAGEAASGNKPELVITYTP